MKTIKKVLLSVIASILMMTVLFAGNVNAATYTIKDVDTFREKGVVGDIIFLKGSDLLNVEDAYCFEHKSEFRGGEYKVWDIVEINGKTAKNLATGKVVTNDENMVMNYILYKGDYERKEYVNGKNGHMSVRNIAIWAYQNTWVNSLGNGFFSKNWKHKYSRYNMSQFNFGNQPKERKQAEQLIKDAENYAKNHKGSANIQITGNTQVNEYQKNTYGPFKIKYSGDDISLSATDINGNNVSNNVIKVYSDKECKNEITKNNIKSNTDFYIKINDGTKIKKLKCTVSSSTLNAKILFTARKDFWNNYGQNIIFVKPGERKEEKSVEFDTKNMKKMSIQGYVWIDTQSPKTSEYNSKYDNGETRVKGVTVRLINKFTNKEVTKTTTNDDGSYTFKEPFYEEELKDHYVEFNYNGVKISNEDISKYIPVAFNSANANEIVRNGSRAIMDNVAERDEKLSGIATTYKGTKDESTYGLGYNGNLYNKLIDGTTLKDINLGIKKIPNTDYRLSEDLVDLRIEMRGYTYTYKYGNGGNTNRVAAPQVNWQKKGTISGYTANIYPSDIAYDVKNSTQELKLYVKYRIDIENTTNYGIGDSRSKWEETYVEKSLHISELTDKFDTKRYELHDSNWSAKDGIATINDSYIKDLKENGISANSTATKYIEFSVKHDAILDILNHPYGIIEDYPTEAITKGYHKYTRKDYSWQNSILAEQTHLTKEDTRNASAPYLIFKLGEERILSGKVFEDKVVTTDGRKLGNGKYEDGENIVKGVIVELLDVAVDENAKEITDITKLPVSKLYGAEGNELRTAISKDAKVITDENGNFVLNGIVPGKYYIRFTYGDGTQIIYNPATKQEVVLNAKDYKSTIVTNEVAKASLIETLNGKEYKNGLWYRELGDSVSSIAIDNLNTRIAVNEGNSKNIMAGTAKIDITIENTADAVANIEITEQGQKELSTNRFDGMNLGIIEQPKQEAKIEKIITNMMLTTSENKIEFNGNPETDVMNSVNDLDYVTNGGSTYARIEMKDDLIYGSTVELTYRIKITNISDINYYNYEYYWFGIENKNKEVTLNISKVLDYLDEALIFDAQASDSRIKVEHSEDRDVLNLDISENLYTEKNKEREVQQTVSSETVTLVAKRILSNPNYDTSMINEVEATEVFNGTDSRDNDENKDTEIKTIRPINQSYKGKATAFIAPPQGQDRLEIILYIIAGTIGLAVLSAGIVMIRKILVK